MKQILELSDEELEDNCDSVIHRLMAQIKTQRAHNKNGSCQQNDMVGRKKRDARSTVKYIKNALDMFNTRLNKNKRKIIKLGGGSRETSRTAHNEKRNEKSRVYKHCVEISHVSKNN